MIPSSIYTIDWAAFLNMFVPSIRRKPKHLQLLNAFIFPLRKLHQAFLSFKDESIYKVSHNASVGLLEKVLNDKFDAYQRRIYINNVQREDDLRVYTFPQQREIGIFTHTPVGIRSGNSFNPDIPDFKVYLPNDIQPIGQLQLAGLVIQISAQLDYYKLYAKKYQLIWIN